MNKKSHTEQILEAKFKILILISDVFQNKGFKNRENEAAFLTYVETYYEREMKDLEFMAKEEDLKNTKLFEEAKSLVKQIFNELNIQKKIRDLSKNSVDFTEC